MLLTQRIASHPKVTEGMLRTSSASHLSGTLGANLEVFMSLSRLDEDSWSVYEHQFGTFVKINRQSLVRHPVFPLVSLLETSWP